MNRQRQLQLQNLFFCRYFFIKSFYFFNASVFYPSHSFYSYRYISYYNNNISNNTPSHILKYNKLNNINMNSLDIGKFDRDYLNVFLHCAFKMVKNDQLNALIFLSKNLPDISYLSLNQHTERIYIVSLYPDLLNLSNIDNNDFIEVLSVTNWINYNHIITRSILESNLKIHIIFHSIRWSQVLHMFSLEGFTISGIKSSIRHITSSLHLDLFHFLLKIYGSIEEINKNFIKAPIFSKYWSSSKLINLTDILEAKDKNNLFSVDNIAGKDSNEIQKFLFLYSNVKNKKDLVNKSKLNLDSLNSEKEYLEEKIVSIEDNYYIEDKEKDNRISSLSGQLSTVNTKNRKNWEKKNIKYKGYQEKIKKDKEKLKINLEKDKKEITSKISLINITIKELQLKIFQLVEDYNKSQEELLFYINHVYRRHVSNTLSEFIDNIVIDMDYMDNHLNKEDSLHNSSEILIDNSNEESTDNLKIVLSDNTLDESVDSSGEECESVELKNKEAAKQNKDDLNNGYKDEENIKINNHLLDKSYNLQKDSTLKRKDYSICFRGNRKYSTKISKRLNYSIENTIYDKVYKFIIEANLPENVYDNLKLKKIQYDLEDLLYNQGKIILEDGKYKELAINPHLLPSEINKIITSSLSKLNNLIINLREEYTYENLPRLKKVSLDSKSNSKILTRKIFVEILSIVNNDQDIISILIGRLLRIISNYNFVNENSISTSLYIDVAQSLLNHFVFILFDRYQKDLKFLKKAISNNDISIKLNYKSDFYIIYNITNSQNTIYDTLKQFKEESPYSKYINIFKQSYHLLSIGAWLMEILIECGLLVEEIVTTDKKNKVHLLRPSEVIKNILYKHKIDASFMDLPTKLPMLVKPKDYYIKKSNNREKLGGYLLNNVKYEMPLIIHNPELKNQSKIKKNNNIYSIINYSAKVAFKINKKLLDFVLDNNNIFKFLIDPESKHPLEEKDFKLLTPSEKKELFQFLSDKLTEGHIMRLSLVYRDINKFYIPIRIDNRGRLYAISNYLHYQGSELAKALLLFAKSEKIMKSDTIAINYLKSYGANLFGLSKKSFEEKLNWIEENENDIINYHNGLLISKAENKILFLAFCLEYCKYIESLKDNKQFFYSDFPIQVDSTCNGFQHLALLIGDNSLAEQLNLKTKDLQNKPKDFYSYIALNLKELFKDYLFQINTKTEVGLKLLHLKNNYERLYNLDIHRSLIKKPVMTKPYNVSITSMQEYILDEFYLDEESKKILSNKEGNRDNIFYTYKKDHNIKLLAKDILLLSVAINDLIYNKFPNLLELTDYFKKVAKICNTLKISIPWILPSGLEINQEYLESKILKVKPFTHKKDTYNLRLPDSTKISNLKQIRSLMPNIIHSLDSTSLVLVINMLCKETDKFYSVHDCFATTSNNIEKLINTIRLVYFSIYSKEQYLIKFDMYLREHISKMIRVDSTEVKKKSTYFANNYPDINNILKKRNFNYQELLKSQPVI